MKNEKQQYFGGCDVGSTTGKAIILSNNNILASAIVPSEIYPEQTAKKVLEEAIQKVEDLKGIKQLNYLIGTGYGRTEVPFANENISEISCHALGAYHCDNDIRTIIDIGGQDVKVVSVKNDGSVLEFVMNDKCAAGTGRFFEAMARIFQMEINEFAKLSLKAKKSIPVSAQCSVFAETEVVSLISRRNAPADIALGIQEAVGRRVFSLAKRVGIIEKVTITGGCSKNLGLIKILDNILGVKIAPLSEDPQLMGALGAAVMARRKINALINN